MEHHWTYFMFSAYPMGGDQATVNLTNLSICDILQYVYTMNLYCFLIYRKEAPHDGERIRPCNTTV